MKFEDNKSFLIKGIEYCLHQVSLIGEIYLMQI